jgi:hypothetical protein
MDNFMKRVSAVQAELKAPKGQYNSFGKYRYRSCEDILEAVKPLLVKYGIVLTINDELIYLGDRYYIKSTACLRDTESECSICNSALAREEETKKGMDGSQITGTASSYARKYALNGLFCIDDTKDADTDEYAKNQAEPKKEKTPRERLIAKLNEKGIDVTAYAKEKGLSSKTTAERFEELLKELE